MYPDEMTTQEKILAAGKKEFLAFGYKNASLRNIVKQAGFTLGAFYGYYPDKSALFEALVKPVADGMLELFTKAETDFFDHLEASVQSGSFGMDDFSIRLFIEYIYDNYDEVKLLITRAEGTAYGDYIHTLVEIDVESFYRYFEWLENAGIEIEKPDRNLIHILTNAHYCALFEVIVHDMSKESALLYTDKVVRFFISGWTTLLGL